MGPTFFTGNPKGSQIAVISLASIAAISIAPAYLLLKANNNYGLLFLCFGLLAGYASYDCARKSQKHADLANTPPTQINDFKNGLGVTTSTAVLHDQVAMQHLSNLFQVVSHREPLPAPSGKVTADGAPDPSRQGEAIREVTQINEEGEAMRKQVTEQLSARLSGTVVVQNPPNEQMRIDIGRNASKPLD